MEKLFQINTKSIGEIRENQKRKVIFKASRDLKHLVHSVSSSCSCSKPRIKGNTIEVVFNSKRIPEQTRGKGYMHKTSYITVTSIHGVKENLYVKAKIII